MSESVVQGTVRLRRRSVPAAGIIYVVLYATAIVLFADFPGNADPAEAFAAAYTERRASYIAGGLIFIAAIGLFVWFSAGLVSRLRDGGEPDLAATLTVSAAAYISVLLASLGTGLGLVTSPASGEVDPTVIKAVEAISGGVLMLSWLPLAITVFAFGLGAVRCRIARSWFGVASTATAAILVLGTTMWAESGFWAPWGAFSLVVGVAILLWVLAASIVTLRAPASPVDGSHTG